MTTCRTRICHQSCSLATKWLKMVIVKALNMLRHPTTIVETVQKFYSGSANLGRFPCYSMNQELDCCGFNNQNLSCWTSPASFMQQNQSKVMSSYQLYILSRLRVFLAKLAQTGAETGAKTEIGDGAEDEALIYGAYGKAFLIFVNQIKAYIFKVASFYSFFIISHIIARLVCISVFHHWL